MAKDEERPPGDQGKALHDEDQGCYNPIPLDFSDEDEEERQSEEEQEPDIQSGTTTMFSSE